MRLILALTAAALLAGCTSNEYSKVPEPTGEWVAANPASLTAPPVPPPAALPARQTARQTVRSYWASRGVQQ